VQKSANRLLTKVQDLHFFFIRYLALLEMYCNINMLFFGTSTALFKIVIHYFNVKGAGR